MKQVSSLIYARWLVTVDAQNTILENHALAINNGKIVDILPVDAAREKYQAEAVFNQDRHIVMPGLINTHTHAAMSLFRGLADDLALQQWLAEHIWPAEQKFVDSKFVEDGTELAIAEMLLSGTTCFNDMYFYPDITARVVSKAGIRASIGLIVLEFPTVWAQGPDEYISKGITVHDEHLASSRITTAWAPHAPYTVTDETFSKIQVMADELQILIHLHLHETATEITDSVKQYGGRPLARLDSLGLVGPQLIAVHMTQLTDAEIELVSNKNITVVHCPGSNMKLASGFCPVPELLDAKVNVALGTDSAASNNTLDMFKEMNLASLVAKAYFADATNLKAREVIRMATINGARALGIDKITGSLQIGKEADVIALDMNKLHSSPMYSPESHLLFAANGSQVSEVWVAGQNLVKNSELLTVDKTKLMQKTKQWSNRILG